MSTDPARDVEDPSAADVRREFLMLALLTVLAVAVFLVTRTVAEANREQRTADAEAWFAEGVHALGVADHDEAIDRLRRAVALNPQRTEYRLALARGLELAGRDADAAEVLVALRELSPENPEVNLQLARLEARAGGVDAAGRYYQLALAALWPERDADRRRAVRFELIDYLLEQQRGGRALSELLVLNADVPPGVEDQIRIGRLFLAAGDPRRAAQRFADVLQQTPDEPRALAGAGLSAFALGDYTRTLKLLGALPEGVADAEVQDARAIATLVLDRDPLAARLGARERTRRLRTTAAELRSEVEACLSRVPAAVPGAGALSVDAEALSLLAEPASQAPGRTVTLDRDEVEEGLDRLVQAVERMNAAGCGARTVLDRAVELMASRHALSTP